MDTIFWNICWDATESHTHTHIYISIRSIITVTLHATHPTAFVFCLQIRWWIRTQLLVESSGLSMFKFVHIFASYHEIQFHGQRHFTLRLMYVCKWICLLTWYTYTEGSIIVYRHLDLYSLGGRMSYHKISWSPKASKPRVWNLDFCDTSDIWQTPRQQRCRDACQISEPYDHHNIQSRFRNITKIGGKRLTA